MQSHHLHSTPLVFIPGLFGSMSHVIVPGTGGWGFGIAGVFYEPFVMELESMGYKRNTTLFVAFYDWRQPITYSAHTYLVHAIKEAKRITGASKVNLVGHSMGGMVARAYTQSDYYQRDVDQLIMMCSPNAGSPANYSYWTGGTIQYPSGVHPNVVSLYMHQYLNYLYRLYPTNKIAALRTHFPSLSDMIPSKAYGDYLIVRENESLRLIPYSIMQVKNTFLDHLNADQDILKRREIDVTLIAGIGQSTIQNLQKTSDSTTFIEGTGVMWAAVNSDAGDGNAMVSSVFVVDGDKYLVEGDHMEVLFRSRSILKKKLT
ncbi:alpha/beta fold hydrolase [Paenibacillus sp. RC67]|uniref:esterase/lipase family protein n=1 Tax=Paenibacillus sp. RC67 TaxID=3039392 RepID=UPI0024AE6DE3|nr:alpha/beta fold hydrolase [Paenibacillus sp. RC67]